LEAAWRPGHLDGVATVVARLFGLVRPNRAYFGLKDYQQFLLVRRLSADLALPVELRGCPTLREADGLAMSSRNRYLDPQARTLATEIFRALKACAKAAQLGERSIRRLRQAGLKNLSRVPGLKIQYFEVVDQATLEPLRSLEGPARVLTACVLKGTRLIDNLPLALGRARPQGKAQAHA
ncbi:MAG: 4-phosphopantoate--beta-alanine ligase, partial [bacterium]